MLAYATTIHKSQGSEYPAVVIPLTTQHYPMLQRNLVYTGVTRGKRLVVLVGQLKALAIAVKGGGRGSDGRSCGSGLSDCDLMHSDPRAASRYHIYHCQRGRVRDRDKVDRRRVRHFGSTAGPCVDRLDARNLLATCTSTAGCGPCTAPRS